MTDAFVPNQEYYLAQIDHELATAREATNTGNEGKARVCARRAAGQAITWFLSRYPREGWGADAMTQLLHLKTDAEFPEEVRNAAERLTTKISERFTYPFTSHPINDATIIIDAIIERMSYDAHRGV